MTWVESAEITGLAGRSKPCRVQFNRGINIFWGLNGNGKTSFLKIIDCALSGSTAPLLTLPFRTASIRFYTVVGDHYVNRQFSKAPGEPAKGPRRQTAELVRKIEEWRREIGRSVDMDRIIASTIGTQGIELVNWTTDPQEADGKRFQHRYLPISRVFPTSRPRGVDKTSYSQRNSDIQDVSDELDYDQKFAANIESTWQRHSNEETRAARQIQQRGLISILNSVINPEKQTSASFEGMDAGDAYRAVLGFFRSQGIPLRIGQREFAKRYDSDPTLSGIVAQVVDVERRILKAQEPSRKLADLLRDLFYGGKSVTFGPDGLTVSAGDSDIPLYSLSSGEKQLLLILIETMAAGENTIIIDEPEISMHVDWQRRLIDAMTTVNPEAQIIVATHSPELMVGRSDDEIFEL